MPDLTEDETWELSALDGKPDLTPEESWRAYELHNKPQAPETHHLTDALNTLGTPPQLQGPASPVPVAQRAPPVPSAPAQPHLKAADGSDITWDNQPSMWTAGIDQLKKHVVDPYVVEPIQEAMRTYLNPAFKDIGEHAPGVEYALRNINSLTMGPFANSADVNANAGQNNMGNREAAGVNQAETALTVAHDFSHTPEAVRPHANAMIQGLMQKMPELPIYAVPGTKVGEAGTLLNAVAHGGSAGLAMEMITPGGVPSEGAAGGMLFGAGAHGVTKAGGKVVEGARALRDAYKYTSQPLAFVPGEEVQQFATKLSEALPGFKFGAEPSAKVVDLGADGRPVVKTIEFQHDGPKVVDETAVDPNKTPAFAKTHYKPIITDAAAEQLTDAELAALRAEPAEKIKRKLAGSKGYVSIFNEDMPMEQIVRPSSEHYQDGVVIVGDNANARIQDINDPALKVESLKNRQVIEITLPDGTKRIGFDGGFNRVYTEVDVNPTMERRPLIRDQGKAGPDNVDVADMVTVLAPEPGEGLPDALTDTVTVPIHSTRAITNDTELKDLIRYADGWRSTDPRSPENAIPLEGLPPEPPPPPMDGNGPNGEPPGPPPGPGQVPPNFEVELNWWQKVGMMARNNWRKSVGSHSRGPADLAQLAPTAYSVEHGYKDKSHSEVVHAASAHYGLDQMPVAKKYQFLQELSSVLDGTVATQDFAAKWPEYGVQQRNVAERYKTQVANNSQRLAELDMLPPAEIRNDLTKLENDQQFVDYAARSYLRWDLPNGEYAKLVSRDNAKVDKWKRWLYDNEINAPESKHRLKPETEKWQQVQFLLDDLVGKNDTGVPGVGRGLDYVKSFKQRQDIPKMVREIMGETDNGLHRLATTLARQETGIALGEMWKRVHENPLWWHEAPAATPLGERYVQLPADRSRYGMLAGKYLNPDVYEALVTAPQQSKAATAWWAQTSRILKTNQVLLGGAGPWVNNVLGNVQDMAKAGGVDPWSAGPELGSMWADWKSYKAEPGIETSEASRRWKKSREFFGSFGGMNKADGQVQELAAMRMLETLKGGDGRFAKTDFATWARDATWGNVKKGVNLAGHGFDAVDQAAKYISWTGLLKKGGIDPVTGDINEAVAQKFLGKMFIKTTMPRLKAIVERESARRVHMSFPFMDRTGKWVRTMQDAAGLANPYVGIKTEQMRTTMLLAKRMAEGEPGLAGRMLAYGTTAAALVAGAKHFRRANGVTDEMVQEGYDNLNQNDKRFHPGLASFAWRDSKGRVQFWDPGQGLIDQLAYLQGDPSRDVVKRVIGNIAFTPLDGGLVQTQAQKYLEWSGLTDQPYDPKHESWTAARAFGELWKSGALPTVVPRAMDQLQQGGLIGEVNPKSPKPVYTPAQAVTNAVVGHRVFPAPTASDVHKEVRYEKKDAKREYHSIKHDKAPDRFKDPVTGILQGLFGQTKKADARDEYNQKKQQIRDQHPFHPKSGENK